MPDFKTIADFRKDNGKAIRSVCREFIVMCRELKLFSAAIVATDGSKFKAVNNRDKNFTDRKLKARMQQLDESIARYMTELEARDAIGTNKLTVFADRGYFKGEEILDCERAGIKALVPKSLTSNNRAAGLFDKADFRYIPAKDEYRCPAGQRAIWRFTTIEHDLALHNYWSSACPRCPIKAQCTTGDYRRTARWEHENVLDAMQKRLDCRLREYAAAPSSIPSARLKHGWERRIF
jgi:hypothetical protein